MDRASTDSAPGLDPNNFLDSWDFTTNTNTHNPNFAWDKHTLDNLPELDPYQDSNEGDAELLELIAAQGPPSRDSLDQSVIDSASLDFSGSAGLSERVSFVGGTFSPRTYQAADDTSLPDNGWNSFQLPTNMGLAMPLDAASYSKETVDPNDAVIVDDNEFGMRGMYQDYQQQHHTLSSYQQLRRSFSYNNSRWNDRVNHLNVFAQNQLPISPPLDAQSEKDSVQMNSAGLDQQWFAGVDMSHSTKFPGEYSRMSQGLSTYDGSQPVKLEHSNGSSSPSMPDNSSIALDAYSIGNNDISITSESATKDDLQVVDWDEPTSQDNSLAASPEFPKVSGFMVSQDLSDISPISLEANSQSLPPRHTLGLQPVSGARRRKQRGSVVSIEQIHKPLPLQIVQEDGLGGAISSEDFVSPPRGARRKGPLSTVGRANAGLRRKNKDTCVQCRLNKRKCDGNAPCDACRPTLHEQPCARACFASIVEYGTCNYISQRAINHVTRNGTDQRVRIEIPSAFDLHKLVAFLGERRGKFNIRASQSWGSLYVLDLGETYKFLKGLSEYSDNSQSTFLEFIDHRIIDSKDKSKNWLSCVKDCDPMNNVYQLLSQWNNMPSRASYSFVSLDGSSEEQLMDVSSAEDREDILLAAQLSRIVCRMLEVEGFRKLERDFYNIKWKRITPDAHMRFLEELGHILLSLRWRVSWWRRLGDGGANPDPSQQHYVDRVDHLCQILYVYYTNVLAKLPSWSASDTALKGKWSRYADTENEIWDDYPADTTENGFVQWMARGRELIEQAGSPHRVSSHIKT
ncbi:hypothetical protein BGW36DRAFT_395505 [Talaromyces proteolyticus]|uniref:Zn(2)-C6 fungal-type domain-containing protein n=1 Tax=Talaromyces proteolyticus TaxID=1131652 RepID=A0AAD4Q2G3_9EURO|nr:uncharacterized protein BGW36DRAFT_395505 [Talaromyces proteolyticus]KAH8700402.1 hypothetical protein BGW36DRAFT_395505 [Talaromyces proteolyticus]